MMDDPFPDLQIEDSSFLNLTDVWYICDGCSMSRKFYCCTCCTPNPHLKDYLPKVELPVKVDIIKDQKACDGKKTYPHAAVLAPNDVNVYTFPYIPDYDPEKVVLVYPCYEASTLKTLVMSLNSLSISTASDAASATAEAVPSASASDACQDEKATPGEPGVDAADAENPGPEKNPMHGIGHPIERAVFIDSDCNHIGSIIQDERLKNLRRVELHECETQFWWCQEAPDTYDLSNIEAIYHFMREYHDEVLGLPYFNEYDNLLFFMMYLYGIICEQQDEEELDNAE